MSVMVSRTYVNEVDIQKIKTGQTVTIGLDAFPEKKFTGKVITVANVGEQKPNSDSKVFEVDIEVAERDTTILPAMTTSNLILAETIDKALSIPLEGVFAEGQMTYSFKKSGSGVVKQEIRLGKTNDNEAIVTEGLAETDQVLLTRPANADKLELVKLKNSNADKQPALSKK
jgi:multidrug efflux pump subunit AcrA (membrane-fusion protein)